MPVAFSEVPGIPYRSYLHYDGVWHGAATKTLEGKMRRAGYKNWFIGRLGDAERREWDALEKGWMETYDKGAKAYAGDATYERAMGNAGIARERAVRIADEFAAALIARYRGRS